MRKVTVFLVCLLALGLCACGDDVRTVNQSDASVDLARADLAEPDMARPDLTVSDLPAPDLAVSDLPAPDLAVSDLPVPDLAVSDLPVPDLAVSDLPAPDLQAPDLPVPDLTPPDMPLPTCTDKKMNGLETDVDCGGGTCPKCADLKLCKAPGDCLSGVCDATGKCAPATCADKVKNGNETDVDCGGLTCPKCVDKKLCKVPGDCLSGVCASGVCAAATCVDKVQNGSETDVDCGGGACPKCADTKICKVPGDCLSGVCTGGKCAPATGCKQILANNPAAKDGVYKLDPCGTGAADYYCYMSKEGGGWTVAGWQAADATTNMGITDQGTVGGTAWSKNLKCMGYSEITVFNRTMGDAHKQTYPAATWNATTTNMAIGTAGTAFKQGVYGPKKIMMGCVDYKYSGSSLNVAWACDSDSVKSAKGHFADYAGEYCPGGRLDTSKKWWAWTDGTQCKYLGTMYTWGFAIR